MDEKQRHAAGMTVRREILDDVYVDRAVADTTDVTREFQDLLTRYAWGEIWTRPRLDHRTRRVLVLGTQSALKQWDQQRLHILAAVVEGGFSANDLQAIVLQQAIDCGALTAMNIVREVLEEIELTEDDDVACAGEEDAPEGLFKWVSSVPGSPVVASCISARSSVGLNFRIRWFNRSTTQTFPSQSTSPEWSQPPATSTPSMSISPPDRMRFPSRSNTRIVCRPRLNT